MALIPFLIGRYRDRATETLISAYACNGRRHSRRSPSSNPKDSKDYNLKYHSDSPGAVMDPDSVLIPTALPADEHIPCARQISVMSPAVVDSTLDDGHANPSSISLKVCTDCKDALLRSFHHCLSHQGEMPELSSFYEIDEIKDAIQLKEPPYFDILRDPTAKVPPVDLESEQHKVIRDRWVFAEQKKSHKENKFFCFQAAQQRSVAGQNSKGFSGALYKRMLDHKDKEIQTLKAQLYDRHLAENHESQNVHRLKNALSKAVKYYTFAEEWQKSESGRLQKDVQFLKAELSSLMAFLINAEDEKQRLRSEIDQANEIVKARDAQILENQKKEQELRDKLQKNYKDFIAMDATIVQLRKEALKGTEAAESRNDMLQRNLDKLAFDFEGTTKNLRAATLKIKELEFEMEEIVSQFNQTGEAKKKSEELNLRIAADLAQTSAELRSTKEDLDQTLIIKARLEADLRKSQEDASVMQKNLEAKIVHLTQDLSTALSLKTDLEYTVRQLKAEIDKVNANAKALAKAKETVEQNMRAAQIKSDREIQNRDTKITTFENMRADDAKLIKKLQDAKEQARSQVTELQTSLDREVSNMNVLSFETAQFKRHAEERISNLEDQLEKMTLAKSNLSNDKVQLLEKIKSMRIEIKSKEDELEFTKVAYKKQGEEALASDMRFRGLVVGLESDLKALNGDHEGLTQEFITLQLNFKNITNDLEYTRQQLSDLGVKHDNSVNRVSQLESRNEYLMKEHSQAVQERAEMKIHLESVLSKNEELMISSRHLETELTDKLKRATAQITKMSNEMMNTRDEEARLKVLATALKELSTKLDTELATTRTKLSDEIQTREGIEHDLFEVRKSLTYERNRRLEVEKMQSRLGRSDELRSLERLSLFKMRDYKLGVIYEDLSTQLTHLTKFVEMLPEGLEFGETDVKPIALFNTTSGGTNGKKEGGKELLRKAADHVGPKGQSPIERSLRARKSSKGTNGQKCP